MSESLEQQVEPERCDGCYPVPQTSPSRDEPFAVTYRCALNKGHAVPHGAESLEQQAAKLPKRSVDELVQALRVRADYLTGEKWEAPATAAMMREAADALQRVQAETERRVYDELRDEAHVRGMVEE